MKHKYQNGFSMIEAIVVASVIATMSALVLTGASGARDTYQVRNAAQQFASDLRETVLLTKNGVNVPCPPPLTPEESRQCSSYKIVVPIAGGDTYVRKVVVGTYSYGTKTFSLPPGVKFITTDNNLTASFDFVFPATSVTALTGSVFPGSGVLGTLGFTMANKNDTSIKNCVSITSNGSVSVKSGSC